VVQPALVVLEIDFSLLERAGTRPTLNETAEMDQVHERALDRCRPLVRQAKQRRRPRAPRYWSPSREATPPTWPLEA
jgi:hypothetical protein